MTESPRIGIVLSSGGIRGVYEHFTWRRLASHSGQTGS